MVSAAVDCIAEVAEVKTAQECCASGEERDPVLEHTTHNFKVASHGNPFEATVSVSPFAVLLSWWTARVVSCAQWTRACLDTVFAVLLFPRLANLTTRCQVTFIVGPTVVLNPSSPNHSEYPAATTPNTTHQTVSRTVKSTTVTEVTGRSDTARASTFTNRPLPQWSGNRHLWCIKSSS